MSCNGHYECEVLLYLSPLRGCQEPESYCISHSADRAGASSSPEMTPSQLHAVETVTTATSRLSHLDNTHIVHACKRGDTKTPSLLTEIHRLVASGADVGSSGERWEACSWRGSNPLYSFICNVWKQSVWNADLQRFNGNELVCSVFFYNTDNLSRHPPPPHLQILTFIQTSKYFSQFLLTVWRI